MIATDGTDLERGVCESVHFVRFDRYSRSFSWVPLKHDVCCVSLFDDLEYDEFVWFVVRV